MWKKGPYWSYMEEHMGICVLVRDSHLCMWGPPPLCCRGGPTWKWLGCTESEITEEKTSTSRALLRLLLSFTHKHTHAHTGSHRSQQDARTQLCRKQAAALQPLCPKAAHLRGRLCRDKAAVWLPSCRSGAEWGRAVNSSERAVKSTSIKIRRLGGGTRQRGADSISHLRSPRPWWGPQESSNSYWLDKSCFALAITGACLPAIAGAARPRNAALMGQWE